MLSLRLLRLFSVRSTCSQAPILQESYKVCKETGFRSLSPGSVKMSSGGRQGGFVSYQNVVVMRHGERLDNFEPSWAATAARPWDPPLAGAGRKRAFETGRRIRESVGLPIGRVFVSPFLRCLQTAGELVASLSNEGRGDTLAGDGVAVKPFEVKVSVEYGLCEMMNSKAIRPNVAPKDGNMGFDVAVCEAMLPAEIVDKNVERVYKRYRGLQINIIILKYASMITLLPHKIQLPQWEESVLQAGARYRQLIKDLADKYPNENLLLVTHGEGVKVAVSSFKKDAEVNEVDYCGYVELRRPIFKKDHTFTTGEFDLLTPSGQTGVSYSLPRSLENDTNQTSP